MTILLTKMLATLRCKIDRNDERQRLPRLISRAIIIMKYVFIVVWNILNLGPITEFRFFYGSQVIAQLQKMSTIHVAWASCQIQWSAVITRSDIVRYYMINYKKCVRMSTRPWIHKRHPIPRPSRRAMGCPLRIFWENGPRYNGTALYVKVWVAHDRGEWVKLYASLGATCLLMYRSIMSIYNYSKTSNIRCTKSQKLNDSRLVLQLSLPIPLKPAIKSRMKM